MACAASQITTATLSNLPRLQRRVFRTASALTMATLSKPALRTSPTLSSATLRSAPTARPPSGPQPKWKPKSKVMTATVAAAAGATWRIATMVFIAADLGRALAQRAAPWRMRWTPLSGYWQQGHQLPNRLQCDKTYGCDGGKNCKCSQYNRLEAANSTMMV